MLSIIEFALDAGIGRLEKFSKDLRQDIKASISQSIRGLSALSFLALLGAIAFVGVIASLYTMTMINLGFVVGVADYFVLSLLVLMASGFGFYIIDKKQKKVIMETKEKGEQWLAISKNVLLMFQEYNNQKKLEEEIQELRAQIRKEQEEEYSYKAEANDRASNNRRVYNN
jgi:sensor histidine kinase YesM